MDRNSTTVCQRTGHLCLACALAASGLAFTSASGAAFAQAREAEPAAQTSEDTSAEDLAKRLLDGPAADEAGDLMSRILKSMDDVQRRLYRRFDPGPETRAVQVRIVQGLDDAIKLALQQRSKSSSAASGSGDQRRMPDPPKRKQADTGRAEGRDTPEDQAARPAGDADAPEGRRSGAFKESRRGWGHLPPREREEIIQGIAEDVVESYRELIDRYYRALAEIEEP